MNSTCPPAAVACSVASYVRESARALAAVSDRRFAARALAWSVVSLLGFGLVAAIIPNPVFGRSIPPEPFAIAVWLVSAPMMGLIAATYGPLTRIPAAATAAVPMGPGAAVQLGAGSSGAAVPLGAGSSGAAIAGNAGSTAATLGGMAAFLAIGCPLCNKIALLLLGASGALSVFAPLQPVIGAASLALLGGTLAWRLRLLASGNSCTVPARA